jgi:hypothetical protein
MLLGAARPKPSPPPAPGPSSEMALQWIDAGMRSTELKKWLINEKLKIQQ